MAYSKQKAKVAASSAKAKVFLIVSILWTLVWLSGIFQAITQSETFEEGSLIPSLVVYIVCTAIGIFVFYRSLSLNSLCANFKKYVTFLSGKTAGYIPEMAAACGRSPEQAKSDLVKMISRGFFVNARINAESNMLIVGDGIPGTVVEQTGGKGSFQTVSQKCPCCGGMNVGVEGTSEECDYCGSPMSF